jgi:hypothetical protein
MEASPALQAKPALQNAEEILLGYLFCFFKLHSAKNASETNQ